MKQKRTIVLVFTLLLLSAEAAAAKKIFIDLSNSPYTEAIFGLADRGIVQGYSDDTFRPEATINRAEFVKILIESRFPGHTPSDVRCFTDLEVKTPQWYANSVCSARELGIVSGYPDGSFLPDRTVNLAEALKMALGSFDVFPTPISGAPWYEPYLKEARSRGILSSILQNPGKSLTRGEMAQLTYILVLGAEHAAEHAVHTASICGNGIKEESEQCDDGNIQDSDGCSSICILVPEPVRRAILQIDAQATGTVTTIAQGQRHVALLKFTVTAGRQDALLTSLTFSPTVGSLLFAKNYTLAMDRNGTGTYQSVVQADGKTDGSRLIFDTLDGHGVLIPKGLTISFVLTADLVSTLGPVSLGVNFATESENYIQAQGAIDGITLTGIETNNTCTSSDCFIRVNTQTTTDINVVQRGSLFITEDSQPAGSHIIIGGSVSPPLLRLRFHAVGEDIIVPELRIDGITNSVDSLLLTEIPTGETASAFAQASTGQCSNQPATRACAVFGYSALVIPANQEVVVTVAAKMKPDSTGGMSGENVTISLGTATDDIGLSVKARGLASNQDLAQNNGDASATGEVFIGTSSAGANRLILGRTHDTSLASILDISNAGAEKGTSIPSGNTVIGSFRFDASAHSNTMNGSNDVVLKTLTFHVNAQNVQIDPASYRLAVSNDQNAELACNASGTTGAMTVVCNNVDNGTIQSHIGQGQWVIFTLKANVTNTAIAQGLSSLLVELPLLGNRAETNSVIWSDEVTTFQWVDVPVSSVRSTLWQR